MTTSSAVAEKPRDCPNRPIWKNVGHSTRPRSSSHARNVCVVFIHFQFHIKLLVCFILELNDLEQTLKVTKIVKEFLL